MDTGELVRKTGEDVGSYAIEIGTLALADDDLSGFKASNYKLEITPGIIFNIKPRQLTITNIKATTRNYDGTTKVALTDGGLINVIEKDKDTVTCIIPTEGTLADANVGNNKEVIIVTPELTGTASDNYTLEDITYVTVDISPAIITVIPDENQTKYYGCEDSDLTYTYTSLIPNETPAFTGKLGRETGEEIKDYRIQSGTLAIIDEESTN